MKKEASGYITVSKIHGFRKNNIRKYIILIKSIRVNFKADQITSNPTNCRVHENMFSTTHRCLLKAITATLFCKSICDSVGDLTVVHSSEQAKLVHY